MLPSINTKYVVTIDDDTLNNGTVTIRDRDTMKQEVIKIEESKVDTVEAEEIEVVDFEELGEDVTDKRYYKKCYL